MDSKKNNSTSDEILLESLKNEFGNTTDAIVQNSKETAEASENKIAAGNSLGISGTNNTKRIITSSIDFSPSVVPDWISPKRNDIPFPSIVTTQIPPDFDENESTESESESLKKHTRKMFEFTHPFGDVNYSSFKHRNWLSFLTCMIKGKQPSLANSIYSSVCLCMILLSCILLVLQDTYVNWRIHSYWIFIPISFGFGSNSANSDFSQLRYSLWGEFSIPWYIMESLMLAFFLFDFCARFYICSPKLKFLKSFTNWVDLLALTSHLIFPLPSGFFLKGLLYPFRVIRVIRILYIFHVSRHSIGLTVTYRALMRSLDALVLYGLFILLIMLTSSTYMFQVERGVWDSNSGIWRNVINGEVSKFQSVTDSLWWSIVTLTTVGYGDTVPVTSLGKIVAGLTMIFSIMIIALPTSIIGSNFMAEWQGHQRMEFKRKMNMANGDTRSKYLTELQENNDLHVSSKRIKSFNSVIQSSAEETKPSAVVAPSNSPPKPKLLENDTQEKGRTCANCQRYNTAPFNSKRAKIRIITDHNEAMLDLIGEMQDMLADVNPPEYYRRYKKTQTKLRASMKKISELEEVILTLNRQISQLQQQVSSPFYGPNGVPDRHNSSNSFRRYSYLQRLAPPLSPNMHPFIQFNGATGDNTNQLNCAASCPNSPKLQVNALGLQVGGERNYLTPNGYNNNNISKLSANRSASVVNSNSVKVEDDPTRQKHVPPPPSSSSSFRMIPIDHRIATMPSFSESNRTNPLKSWRKIFQRE